MCLHMPLNTLPRSACVSRTPTFKVSNWYKIVQVKSLYCAANKLRGTFGQCSPAVKKHFISCLLHANACLPIVEQIHTDYSMKRLSVACAYATMPTELCITYREIYVFAHTKLTIVSGDLMPF